MSVSEMVNESLSFLQIVSSVILFFTDFNI